jgi:mannose-1-phosphate guanylyltransferase
MSLPDAASSPRFAPVILAGGSGTRFWPRSRRARAKQVLALDGDRTMIQQTLARLQPLSAPEDLWVITNDLLAIEIAAQLPEVTREHILSEPMGRNTAPACALAAFLLERTDPAIVLGIFPSDHVVTNRPRFLEILREGIAVAGTPRTIVVLGVPPTRPETGYGYIAQGASVAESRPNATSIPARQVIRFTEKPGRACAEEFLAAGNFAWNSGIFLWRADTLANAIREHCPELVPPLDHIAAAFGTPAFGEVFAREYPACKAISIDYAVLEPRSALGEGSSGIVCLPADFGWNDLGSWDSLYEHRAIANGGAKPNVLEAEASIAIEAHGNYVHAPGKVVTLLGVENLVVVDTGDALLITTRERSQDVGKLTRALADAGHDHLT